MSFPTIVYRCPGPYQRKGGTYDYRGVKNQAELDEALKAGWFRTMPEATGEVITTELTRLKDEIEVLGDDAPPTRAELEQQAKELGIRFNKKTTDAELRQQIDAELGS